MLTPPRHDWQAIVKVIKAGFRIAHKRRLTSYKLGEISGLDHSSIDHLETTPGAQPKHHAGEVLLILYAEYKPYADRAAARKKSGKIPIVRSDKALATG